jgi:hypothetical protein
LEGVFGISIATDPIMCKISDKLKLCSCKTKDLSKLKYYWVLNRPSEQSMFILGEIIMPAMIGEDLEQFNIVTLQNLLNPKAVLMLT